MRSRFAIAVVALILIAGALALAFWSPQGPRSDAAPSATPDARDGIDTEGSEVQLKSVSQRFPVRGPILEEPATKADTPPVVAAPPVAPAQPCALASLSGRFLDPAGKAIRNSTRGNSRFVRFTDTYGVVQGVPVVGDRYRIEGLAPGHWWARADAPGYRTAERELDLLAGELKLDFILEPKVVLKVKVVTPDGQALRAAAREARASSWSALIAVATLEAPGEQFPFSVQSGLTLGVGRFRPYYVHLKRPPDLLGSLELDVDPPVFASLALGTAVLGTQPVPAGLEEVTFVLTIEEAEAALATIRFRVRDWAGQPPLGSFLLERTESEGEIGSLAREDEVVLHRVPGEYDLRVMVAGHETIERKVRAEPGEEIDLGTIHLERAVVIRGRLVAPGGEPLQDAGISWGRFAGDGSVAVDENFRFWISEDGVPRDSFPVASSWTRRLATSRASRSSSSRPRRSCSRTAERAGRAAGIACSTRAASSRDPASSRARPPSPSRSRPAVTGSRSTIPTARCAPRVS